MQALRLPRLNQTIGSLAAFVLAAIMAVGIAWICALAIETRSAHAVTSRLMTEGYTWANVSADGLQVHLNGTAPNETARFRAVNLAGTIVDSGRLRDGFEVTPAQSITPPRFSVEMLRNDDGIQLIGLLPQGPTESLLIDAAKSLSPDLPLAEMLETAAYPAPDGWDAAMAYGLAALKLLPRSKISVDATGVRITAIAESGGEKRGLEAELETTRPKSLAVSVDISAPRPVLTPFTLRFVKDAAGPRFDACAADTEKARDRILAASRVAGVEGPIVCTIGLGVPTPKWAEAAEVGIRAVNDLGSGTITFSDADVTLMAGSEVSQALFDRVLGEMRAAMPDVFSIAATLPKKPSATADGPAEFTATLAPDTGKVELRGRLTDDRVQAAVDGFARANFGADNVAVLTRLDGDLPNGWPERVLAGLASLSLLESGTLLVRADTVEVAGVTGSQAARARMSQILSDQLGQGQTFKVDVRYDATMDPLAALPTPQDCVERVTAVQAGRKIAFAPGSAEIDVAASTLMDAIAASLKGCDGVTMEIAGHTDAQGSEAGNLGLSQARAEAVKLALQGRQVDVSNLRAQGYGEARPIADNGNDTGREANRRIEFTLIGAAAKPEGQPLAIDAAAADPAAEPGAQPETDTGYDFSGDDSASVAPAELTRRPEPRPK